MNIEIEGLSELNAKLSELAKLSKEACKRELADIALDLGGKSSDIAPIDLGDLRGDLANPRKESDLEWKVGSDLPYALKQHECTWFNHPKGGQAKFLESAFNQNVDKYINEIAKAIMKELK